jgi:predicted membrane channel-forming protein YqfA (hemolysin III family)
MSTLVATDWNFGNFILAVLSIFFFVIWFWLIVTVFADLFRRHDISGWIKMLWIIVVILLPLLGVFIYLVSQHQGMADRTQQDVARFEQQSAAYSAADELSKLDALHKDGTISTEEYQRLRGKVVSGT